MNISKKNITFNILKIKLDEFLFIVGVVLLLLSQFILYYNAPYKLSAPNSRVYEQLGVNSSFVLMTKYGGFVCLILCSFFNAKCFLTCIRKRMFVLFSLFLILLIAFCNAIDVILSNGLVNSLYLELNPLVYLLIMTVFISSNDKIYNIFCKLNTLITIFALGMAIFYFITFKIKYPDGIIGNSAFLNYYTLGFFSALFTCYNSKKSIFVYIIIFSCIMIGFLGVTRSFIIQSILLLMIYTIAKAKRKILSSVLLLGVTVGIIGVSLAVLKKYFSSSYEYFFVKLFMDTRSFQYTQLFEQVKFYELIIGKGFYFQYYLNGVLYSYIDNAYIFLLIRYGVFFVLSYVIIFISALINYKKNRCNWWVIIHWVLALGGLSVYVVMGLDVKFLLFYIVLGRSLLNRGGVNGERK